MNLLIVDGTNLAFRYINKDAFANDYIKTIGSLARSYAADRVIVCFDSGASAYRRDIFPEYKAHRAKNRSEAEKQQFDKLFENLDIAIGLMPFEYYQFRGIEADDLITYFAKKIKSNKTWIISSDKDLYQLLDNKTSICNIFRSKQKEITLEYLLESTELSPVQHMYCKCIEGDSGDNIPGVDGIGPKRSLELIKQYGTIENVIAAIPIKSKYKHINNLNSCREQLVLNEKLVNLIDYNDLAIKYAQNAEAAIIKLEEALKK